MSTLRLQLSSSDIEHLPPVTPRRLRRYGETPRDRNGIHRPRFESGEVDKNRVNMGRPPPIRMLTSKIRHHVLSPDDDIIDLTLTSPEGEKSDVAPSRPSDTNGTNRYLARDKQARPASSSTGAEKMLPLFVDDSDEDEVPPDDPFALDDGAILTLCVFLLSCRARRIETWKTGTSLAARKSPSAGCPMRTHLALPSPPLPDAAFQEHCLPIAQRPIPKTTRRSQQYSSPSL